MPGVALAACGMPDGPFGSEAGDRGPSDARDPGALVRIGRAVGAELPSARPRAIQHGPRDRRLVALTFDADMTPATFGAFRSGGPGAYDRRIVRRLREWKVPATIFVTGLWAKAHPGAVKLFARSRRFELGNHSYDHAAWTGGCYGLPTVTSSREKRLQVKRAAAVIEALTDEPMRWFRFPGLCHRAADVRLVAALGEQVVDGDGSGDSFEADPAVVAHTVLDEVRPGSIVVMHLVGAPTAPATAQALETIVPELRARGYRFATLSELLVP